MLNTRLLPRISVNDREKKNSAKSPSEAFLYPEYQRFFARAAGVFGVGRLPL